MAPTTAHRNSLCPRLPGGAPGHPACPPTSVLSPALAALEKLPPVNGGGGGRPGVRQVVPQADVGQGQVKVPHRVPPCTVRTCPQSVKSSDEPKVPEHLPLLPGPSQAAALRMSLVFKGKLVPLSPGSAITRGIALATWRSPAAGTGPLSFCSQVPGAFLLTRSLADLVSPARSRCASGCPNTPPQSPGSVSSQLTLWSCGLFCQTPSSMTRSRANPHM